MNLIELERALRQLRLGGIAQVLETRLRQAQAEAERKATAEAQAKSAAEAEAKAKADAAAKAEADRKAQQLAQQRKIEQERAHAVQVLLEEREHLLL